MRFIYIGDCKAGRVRFSTPAGVFVLPYGEEVEVTYAPLAAKLAKNPEFVLVSVPEDAPVISGTEGSGATVVTDGEEVAVALHPSPVPDLRDAPVTAPRRRSPGRPRKGA